MDLRAENLYDFLEDTPGLVVVDELDDRLATLHEVAHEDGMSALLGGQHELVRPEVAHFWCGAFGHRRDDSGGAEFEVLQLRAEVAVGEGAEAVGVFIRHCIVCFGKSFGERGRHGGSVGILVP